MNFSLEGRNIVVMGVANKRSIAWGIARSLHEAGARLIFTYAGERLEKSVHEPCRNIRPQRFHHPPLRCYKRRRNRNLLRKH